MNLLEIWLTRVLRNKTWVNFDDYHIPEAHRTEGDAEWLRLLFHYFNEAVSFRNKLSAELVVILAISLKSRKKYTGLTFKDEVDIATQAIQSPPSLYAFPYDFNYLVRTIKESMWIDNFRSIPKDTLMLYLEYLPDDSEEYRRSILFIKKDDLQKVHPVEVS